MIAISGRRALVGQIKKRPEEVDLRSLQVHRVEGFSLLLIADLSRSNIDERQTHIDRQAMLRRIPANVSARRASQS